MAEIGDEIAVLDQTESALALGVLRGPMGRGPNGDMGRIAGQIAAAAAAGQFELDVRIAQRSHVAVAPFVDLETREKHPPHAPGGSEIEQFLDIKRMGRAPVHHPIIGRGR